jgi:hypothetical protein
MINPKTEAMKKNPTAQLTQILLNFRVFEELNEFSSELGNFMD